MSKETMDLILRNGRIIDPANELDFVGDIAVRAGKIAAVGRQLEFCTSDDVDFSGCIITPGLIDLHIHGYEHATPLGVNVDECCLARGSTTVVDAGSAGATTFNGLRKFIAEKSKTRILAFLHIASHGLASAGIAGFGGGGECDSLNQVNVKMCCDCIEKNRDMIVGVKVRLAADVANDGAHEDEIYKRGLEAAAKTGLPLMVHRAVSTIGTDKKTDYAGKEVLSCPGSLRAGDFYTHTYHGWKSNIIDNSTGKVHQEVIRARERGVLFDLGHGQGAFFWTVAEKCAEESFWPDCISTDLHTGNKTGPAYDLTIIMSKLLHLGMPLNDVIKATTITPAKAIRWENKIGSLTVGHVADITVLREESVDMDLDDVIGQIRRIKQRLVPVAVYREGHYIPVTRPLKLPNINKMVQQSKNWKLVEIKDADPPPHMPK